MIDPRSVLDVGCGFGRWGFLCREFLDIWNGRVSREQWAVRLVGVDAFGGNLQPHHALVYDDLHGERIEEFLARDQSRFDLIILGDVLEHLPRLQGLDVLEECLRRGCYVLLVLPLGESWPQEALYGNPHERHLAVWQLEDILKLKPLVACEYRDYLDRPYLAAVLSSADPKGVREELNRLTPGKGTPLTASAGRAGSVVRASARPTGEVGGSRDRDRLHVALLSMEYPPFFGGGIATYVQQTARLLGEAGHRVSVLTRLTEGDAVAGQANVREYRFEDEPVADGGSWEIDWLSHQLRRGRWFSLQLAEIHTEDPIDVIEVTDYYGEDLCLDTGALTRGDGCPIPIVTQFHGPRSLTAGLDGAAFSPLLGLFEEIALGGAMFRKTYSPMMRDQVNRLWPGSECAFVPAMFYPPDADDQEGQSEFAYDLLYFGRLERRKGIVPLARALQAVAGQGEPPTVGFVGQDTNTAPGDDSMANWLERELRPCLGSRLHLLDAMPREQLWTVLRSARVLVIPSLWESLGFVVLEGFASNRPVICSDKVGAAYILKGDLAERTLVDVTDADALARKLRQALSMPESLLRQWSREQAQAVRAEFDRDRVLGLTTAYYRQCLASSASPGSLCDVALGRRQWIALLDGLTGRSAARFAEFERLASSWQEQKTFISTLEQERDRLWAEIKRVGQGWEEQKRVLADQKAYITRLEEERDRLWAEVQRLGKAWEDQNALIGQMHVERERLGASFWGRPLRRWARRGYHAIRARFGGGTRGG